jgi:mono/diheme cytochrome c family protein
MYKKDQNGYTIKPAIRLTMLTSASSLEKGFQMKKFYLIFLLALVLAACATSSPDVNPTDKPAQPQPQLQPTLPPVQAATAMDAAAPAATMADGAALLEDRCSECHSTNRAKQALHSRAQWDQTVSRMIGKGAQLSDAEKQVLVDYLATNFGK